MTANTVYFSVARVADAPRMRNIDGRPTDHHSLARALLLDMLTAVWDIPPAESRISAEPSGRPILESSRRRALPFISLSHTRGTVACAASGIGPVGIDIEWHRPGRDHAGIARAAFGPREQERAHAEAPPFYRIWTLREAIAKATGDGLKQAADRSDRVHDGPDEGTWQVLLDQSYWLLAHHRLLEDLNLAIAVMLGGTPSQSASVQRWSSTSLTRLE